MSSTVVLVNNPFGLGDLQQIARAAPLRGILAQTAAHQHVEPVEALAHIAAVDQQKDFQAPAEADHRFAPSRPSNSAAKANSAVLLI